MKTKTLLIAAATLAVGVIGSQAQVYSANIVGYVNITLTNGYNLIANPLNDGNGNNISNILASANLPNKSQIITWAGTVYNTAIGKIGSDNHSWASYISLPQGTGFFLRNSGASTTNTFVGSVEPTGYASGVLVSNLVNNGYNLVGSIMPLGGDLTTDATLNLSSATLANKSQLIGWNTGSQTFNTAVGKISTGTGWSASFPVSVGQGFFLRSSNPGPTNWVQTVQ